MATLFERLAGNFAGDRETKIAVDHFFALIREYLRGEATAAEIRDAFDLTPDQVRDAKALLNVVRNAPNPTARAQLVRDLLFLAEAGYPNISSRYRDEATFTSRVVNG